MQTRPLRLASTLPTRTGEVARIVVDAGITVHKVLGPGLLESAYEVCLVHELQQRGLAPEDQKPLPVVYKDVRLDAGYRIDILCENCVLIELKAVDTVLPAHVAQVMTYLKLSGVRIGFLMNFNTRLFKDGCQRIVV